MPVAHGTQNRPIIKNKIKRTDAFIDVIDANNKFPPPVGSLYSPIKLSYPPPFFFCF